MEGFVKGDIVVLPFPFSDLSESKKRPALVIAHGEYGDMILCQITSKSSTGAIELKDKDFQDGTLKITSYIRPRKLFTADTSLISYKVGKIRKEKIKDVEEIVCQIIKE
jgi:mRNA interferase MazF